MPRSGVVLTLLIAVVVYASGVFVRGSYGTGVLIRNESSSALRNVSVRVEYRGKRHSLPDLPPGKTYRLFVDPEGESSIHLVFVDSTQKQHEEDLASYVETGYCGHTTATVYSNQVVVEDHTFGFFYWKSWLDFIW